MTPRWSSLQTSLPVPILYFLLLSLGIVVLPANPLATRSDLTRIIHLSKATIAFANSSVANNLPDEFRHGTVLIDSPEFESLMTVLILGIVTILRTSSSHTIYCCYFLDAGRNPPK
ncbi:hypothetical protein AHAS_Ahas13G0187300 [Arachis hypogaea]